MGVVMGVAGWGVVMGVATTFRGYDSAVPVDSSCSRCLHLRN